MDRPVCSRCGSPVFALESWRKPTLGEVHTYPYVADRLPLVAVAHCVVCDVAGIATKESR